MYTLEISEFLDDGNDYVKIILFTWKTFIYLLLSLAGDTRS